MLLLETRFLMVFGLDITSSKLDVLSILTSRLATGGPTCARQQGVTVLHMTSLLLRRLARRSISRWIPPWIVWPTSNIASVSLELQRFCWVFSCFFCQTVL